MNTLPFHSQPFTCAATNFTIVGNERCNLPINHKGAHKFVEHDCVGCGTEHGTCCHCMTTHGESHAEWCVHSKVKR